MNQEKIKSIKLNKFRGATQPLEINFNLNKSMIMIFGENGTGKSTIVDAMDFIFNKECGSLKEKSSTNIKSHVPALGSEPQDIEISITGQNQKIWNGKLNGVKPEIKGSENLFSVRILRRDKILKFINAEPKKRYEELKNFIELPHIISSENSLRDCLREIEKNINKEISTNQNQKDTLQRSWEGEGKPGDNYFKWAEEKSKQQAKELEEKVVQYKKGISFIKNSIENWDEFINCNKSFNKMKEAQATSKNKLEKISSENQPQEIIDILENTQTFLNKQTEADKCPACEQPIISEELKKTISSRLQNLKNLAIAKREYEQSERSYNSSKNILQEQQKKLKNSIENLIKFLKEESLDSEIKTKLKKAEEYQFLLDQKIDLKKGEILFEDKKSSLKTLEDIYNENKKTIDQLNLIKTSFESLKKTKQKIKQLESKKEFLNKVLKIVETKRKSYVENILNSISKDVEALYSKLHPKEGLNNISLYLKPKAQGSLEIKSNFQYKTDIPPQAYFSDSHLDTLGICIFIAMAKYFKDHIIILDDVLTSVDQTHMERFIQMLHDENKFFNQIILTTHYRRWRERYKFHRQPNSNIELIELYPLWSLKQGIRHSKTKLAIEELENLKNQVPFDRQSSGSKAGVFLERILDHITLLYRLYAPRKPDSSYTLGELINCFSYKFIEKMKVKKHTGSEILLSNTMKGLFNIAEPIRNKVGSHWNESGMDISDQEVISFLDITIEIGKNFICSECGGLPIKEKSDCWYCGCGKTSLYPLKK